MHNTQSMCVTSKEVFSILDTMASTANLRDMEENEGESALLPSLPNVLPYQYEPRRPTTPDYSEESDTEASDSGEEQIDRVGHSQWCECGECIPMNTETESICCREVGVIDNLVEDLDLQCITQHPGFDGNCLNEYVIETSFYEYIENYYGHVGDDEPIHELYRHVAYRRFTRWVWHRLGRRVRKPVPSCAVHKIRQKWHLENYTGFKYARDF